MPTISASVANSKRLHLTYLDGMRGLAALYVMIFHAFTEVMRHSELPRSINRISRLFQYGHAAVAIFIVLSGFCLMLPIVTGETKQKLGPYFVRRARRILPPYYAALFFSMLLHVLLRPWYGIEDTFWDYAHRGLESQGVISHLLLVHNLNAEWIYQINPPMWSVALEWQIYFLFPLILLPIFRRFGLLASVSMAFLIGLAPHFTLSKTLNLDWTFPWYIGLFGLGMTAAYMTFPRQNSAIQNSTIGTNVKSQWLYSAVLLFAGFLILDRVHISALRGQLWVSDVLIGAGTACLILYCTQIRQNSQNVSSPWVLRLFEASWAVKIGSFSYSLYLLHNLLQVLLNLSMCAAGLGPVTRLIMLLTLGIALCLVTAYGFHIVFERPFLSKPSRMKNAILAVEVPTTLPLQER